jgi:phosphoglycerate dehydrogenase-like enzyme
MKPVLAVLDATTRELRWPVRISPRSVSTSTSGSLRTLPNVVATGHIGFVTEQGYGVAYGHAVENITAWLGGEPVRVL